MTCTNGLLESVQKVGYNVNIYFSYFTLLET